MENGLERERQRLRQRYAELSDGELLRVARDFDHLTDLARELITTELGKRGLQLGDGACGAGGTGTVTRAARSRVSPEMAATAFRVQ
jgi:hypothetical protein